jgi:hypothetical protein
MKENYFLNVFILEKSANMTQVSDVAPRPLVLISIKLQEIVGYLR